MKLSDLRDDRNDPLEIFFDEDAEKGKKKKKKKGKKKDKEKRHGVTSRDAYKEDLKELSRSELHDKLIELGVDTRSIDTDSKKAMRKAIVKKVYGDNDVLPVDQSSGKKKKKKDKDKDRMRSNERIVQGIPPHYYDEDTENFVITRAMDAPDMECFTAMRALGALRKEKRHSDGFGELMERLTDKITQAAIAEQRTEDVIDVTDFHVVDEKPKHQQKALTTTETTTVSTKKEVQLPTEDADPSADNRKKK